MRERWERPILTEVIISGLLLIVDFAFFAANRMIVVDGGWVPLTFGVIVFMIMTTLALGYTSRSRAHITISAEREAEFMPPGIELCRVAIYPVRSGLGQFSPAIPPVSKPMPSMPDRLAANISQTASPTTKQFLAGTLRHFWHARKKSGSGLAWFTSLLRPQQHCQRVREIKRSLPH